MIGITALGSLLDALSNAISIVDSTIAIIVTVFFVLTYSFVRILMKMGKISWVDDQNKVVKIRAFSKKENLAILGALVLLWVPVVLKGRQVDPLDDKLKNCFYDFQVGNNVDFIVSKYGQPMAIQRDTLSWFFPEKLNVSVFAEEGNQKVREVIFEIPSNSDFEFRINDISTNDGNMWVISKKFKKATFKELINKSDSDNDYLIQYYNQSNIGAIRTCHTRKVYNCLHAYYYSTDNLFCDYREFLSTIVNILHIKKEDCHFEIGNDLSEEDEVMTPLGSMTQYSVLEDLIDINCE